jgi:TetR/AcrR family transcriptional repressor of nem operon
MTTISIGLLASMTIVTKLRQTMRLTREQAAENRRLILATAARLFRERGFDGVGIADVMAEAGFTHGGFYNHFPSKEALVAESCATELERSCAARAAALDPSGGGRTWVDAASEYVSRKHRDGPGSGCTVAALAADAGRQGKEIQAAFGDGIETTVGLLADSMGEPRENALRLWSELVGAVVLSRSVKHASPELADEILEATRAALPVTRAKKRAERAKPKRRRGATSG